MKSAFIKYTSAVIVVFILQLDFLKSQTITVEMTVMEMNNNNPKLKLYKEWPTRKVVDSLTLQADNKNYKFKIHKEDYGIYSLRKDRLTIGSPFVLDGEGIKLELSDDQLKIKGTVTQDLLAGHQYQNKIIEDKWRLNGQQYSSTEDMDEKVKLGEQNKQIVDELLAFNIDFIHNNADNMLAPYIASSYMYLWPGSSLQQLETIFATINNSYTKALYAEIKSKLDELKSRSMIGRKMPTLSFYDSQNQKISLADIIRNQEYTLVDFWASWCSPCRATNRQIETIYSELHKKGIEVVSISFDTKHEDWQKAVTADSVSWLQLIDTTTFKGESALLLNIKSLPSTFLVNRSGEIVKEQLHFEDLKNLIN